VGIAGLQRKKPIPNHVKVKPDAHPKRPSLVGAEPTVIISRSRPYTSAKAVEDQTRGYYHIKCSRRGSGGFGRRGGNSKSSRGEVTFRIRRRKKYKIIS
jgi:hypothetical protein